MHFTGLAFLAFLPIVFFTYHLMQQRHSQNVLLLVSSYVFYGWWDYRFCVLMMASSLVDYAVGRSIDQTQETFRRKAWLFVSLTCNLGLLAVFKYFDFFIDSVRDLGQLLGFNMDSGTLEIILPVGISFYTFQTMSYTIDIYRRQLKPANSLVDYLAFVSFFPQLVAGPIERASHLLPQLERSRVVSLDDVFSGLRQMGWGFFKKIVIADSMALIVSEAYSSPDETSGAKLVVATVLFAFQIYCDFSAYSDIAIGTARLFGIQLMRNFAYPYFARSVSEFWGRWHISLSTWFRDYVYIPMGGSRGSNAERSRNIMLTFIVSGLWHGAAWRFVGWGALHGFALLTEKTTANRRSPNRVAGESANFDDFVIFPSPKAMLQMLTTFGIVCMGWVLFRADSVSDAFLIWKKSFASLLDFRQWQPLALEYLTRGPLFYTLNLLLAFILFEWVRRRVACPLEIGNWPSFARWPAYTLVLWFVIEHADRTAQSPFIYFQF